MSKPSKHALKAAQGFYRYGQVDLEKYIQQAIDDATKELTDEISRQEKAMVILDNQNADLLGRIAYLEDMIESCLDPEMHPRGKLYRCPKCEESLFVLKEKEN